MKKSTKAIIAGLTFLAGCEIGLSIQLYRTIRKFIVEDEAMKAPGLPGDESLEEGTEEEIAEEEKKEEVTAEAAEEEKAEEASAEDKGEEAEA